MDLGAEDSRVFLGFGMVSVLVGVFEVVVVVEEVR